MLENIPQIVLQILYVVYNEDLNSFILTSLIIWFLKSLIRYKEDLNLLYLVYFQ